MMDIVEDASLYYLLGRLPLPTYSQQSIDTTSNSVLAGGVVGGKLRASGITGLRHEG